MKRAAWLLVACFLGGLTVLAFASGLRGPVRAEGAAPGASAGDVVINEVAWMGTVASSSDEWIELYNTTDAAIDIANWSITAGAIGTCLDFSAADSAPTTTIPAGGYLLYANHPDDVKNDGGTNIVDIWDATIQMNDSSPGQLVLYDGSACSGNVIDAANQSTGDWFAG